jgi:hypothetical protein
MTPGKWLVAIGGAVMVAAVVAGMSILGSPAHQCALRLDKDRVADLRMLSSLIGMARQRDKSLPSSIAALDASSGTTTDPATGKTYGYKVTGATTFQLCATFDAPSEREVGSPNRADDWEHQAGLQCFNSHGVAGAPAD